MTHRDHLKTLIKNKTRRLNKLKEQHALEGLEASPKRLLEMEDIQKEIGQLRAELQALENPPPHRVTLSDNVQLAFDRCFERGRAQILETLPEPRHDGANGQLDSLQQALLTDPPHLKTIEATLTFFESDAPAGQRLKALLQEPLLQRLIRRTNDGALISTYEQLAFDVEQV